MRKIILLAPFAIFCLSSSSTNLIKKSNYLINKSNSSVFAILQSQDLYFENTTLDFGEIEQNSDGRREFKFTNKKILISDDLDNIKFKF